VHSHARANHLQRQQGLRESNLRRLCDEQHIGTGPVLSLIANLLLLGKARD
jgi:hypothetical protein